MNTSRKKHSARSRSHVSTSLRGALATKQSTLRLLHSRRHGLLRFARNDVERAEREVMHVKLPSLHAPLRVVGRGRGWGVLQLTRCKNESANLPHRPPPQPLPAASREEGSDRCR